MQRREFLWAIGATALTPAAIAAQRPQGATVLYDGRTVTLARIGRDPANAADALWIHKEDLPRINEFELKPQGACRADVCIPIPKTMVRGEFLNLTAFARKAGQSVVADPAARVWSFGEIPVVRGAYLESRMAPDFAVPDRTGHVVKLSQFRGKKVLLVTWASW